MVTFIILLVILVVGIGLTTTYDFEFLGFILIVISAICLFIHCIMWGTVSYNYEVFVEKRKAFVETLEVARKTATPIELAAITKDITTWNISLAEAKYDNKTLFFDQYVDDRVETLQPIK